MLRPSESAGDLWAKAAELERDFAGYKRRLSERRSIAPGTGAPVVAAGDGGGAEEEQSAGEGTGRGRRYEDYVRRRDERLRQEWRARMERKEAEMKALWARLDGARSRRGGDGELASASYCRDQQKSGSLEVKVKPIAPVTPRYSPATKLTRPRTSVPSSPAAASPRLSTTETRRRPSHMHRHLPQAPPPATPRKENRLPPSSTAAAAGSPVTPRPRATLSRSRSMVKECSYSAGRESPRPPRLQPPRTSCDSVGNIKEPSVSPDRDAVVLVQSRPCFGEHAFLAHLKKACAPEPFQFHHGRSGGNGVEPASTPIVAPKDQPVALAILNAYNKCNKNGDDHQSSESDKSGSQDITGDSDTEPSYVYIKRDTSGEQTPRSSLVPACPGTCPQAAELRSEDTKDGCNFEGTMASTDTNTMAGENPMTDAEEESRRASSESLYSNVRSSFSQKSELGTSANNSPPDSPPSCTTPPTDPSPVAEAAWSKESPEEEDADKNHGSSVTVSITVHSPMDAMAGLKRLLTFGKKNGKVGEVATTVVERTPRSLAPAPPEADDRNLSRGRPAGDSVKARTGSSDARSSDNLDDRYVISANVPSLPSFTSFPLANHENEVVLHAKSPRVHRSFFSLPSFKSRAS